MKRQILYPLIVIVIFLLAPTAIFAEFDPNDPGPPDPDSTTENVPIDDGLIVLIAGGIAFGVKKAYDQKKSGVSTG